MRILLTNIALDQRAGSELYIRDMALALLALGHHPTVYSRHLGIVAEELRRATVPVLDDLDRMTEAPDLIHAQHHLEAMTALARFPDTPAIYVCHGWLPEAEAPPDHPRILRYVAVDQLVRSRLIDECGIAPERVEVQLNFVDMKRFPARLEPLPKRPRKALVFSNQLHHGNGLLEIRRACERRDLHLDVIGGASGTVVDAPETVLAQYDLVFAKARAAMEAACSGCAVVLCDAAGLGPRLTAAELDDLRAYNFGVRLLREPIRFAAVLQHIDAYDPEDAASVADELRRRAGLDGAAERLVTLYRRIVESWHDTRHEPRADSVAVARYLRRGPLTGGDFFHRERLELQLELGRTADWARAMQRELEERHRRLDALRSEALDQSGLLQTRDREIWLLRRQLDAHHTEIERVREIAEERARGFEALEQDRDTVLAELSRMRRSLTWRLRERLMQNGPARNLLTRLRRA